MAVTNIKIKRIGGFQSVNYGENYYIDAVYIGQVPPAPVNSNDRTELDGIIC